VSGTGHRALTRYDDVWYVSRHPHLFSSSPSITIPDQNPELAEFFGSMIVLDDPRHLRLRNIVSRAFTPKVVARTEASVRERARRLVDAMIADHPDGTGELVAELAGPLPLQVICDMIGIPEEDHQTVFHWTNVILGLGDPDFATEHNEYAKVSMDFGAYTIALADADRHRGDRRAPVGRPAAAQGASPTAHRIRGRCRHTCWVCCWAPGSVKKHPSDR